MTVHFQLSWPRLTKAKVAVQGLESRHGQLLGNVGSSAGHGITRLRTSKQSLSAPPEDTHFLWLRWEELINGSHPSPKRPVAIEKLAKSPGVGHGLCGRPSLQPPYVLINLLRYMFRNVYSKLEQSGEDRSLPTQSGRQTNRKTYKQEDLR